MADIKKTLDLRAETQKRMKALSEKCERENRELTSEEAADFDQARREFAELTGRYERAKAIEMNEMTLHLPRDERADANVGVSTRTPSIIEGMRILGKEDRAAKADGFANPNFDRGRALLCMLRNDWAGGESERRALSADFGSAGGFLMPESWAANVIDGYRALSTLSAAGARTVTISGDSYHVPRTESDPTAIWHIENVTESDTSMTFKSVEGKLRTPCILIKIPNEAADGNGALLIDAVTRAMNGALAAAIDTGGLTGAGAGGAPMGLLNDGSITTTSLGRAPVLIDDVSAGLLRLENKDVPLANLSLISSPAWANKLRIAKSGDGDPMTWPDWWRAIRQFSTTAIGATYGTGANETKLLVGDFSNVLIIVSTGSMRFEVSRAAGTSFQALQTWVRLYARTDIVCVRPKGLEIIDQIEVS